MLSRGASSTTARAQVKDPYTTLGVARGANGDEIKEAYRQAALRTHPDMPEGSAEAFRLVGEAYRQLSDPVARLGARLRDRYRNGDGPGSLRTPAGGVGTWAPRPGLRAVRPERAEELFRQAFGRGVDEVLDEEMERLGVASGVHSNAIREAKFAELLTRARATAAGGAPWSGGQRSSAATAEQRRPQSDPSPPEAPQPAQAEGEASPVAERRPEAAVPSTEGHVELPTRRKLTTVMGVPVVRVIARVRGPDGRIVVSTTDKPVYRM